jgi:hypothetical protein
MEIYDSYDGAFATTNINAGVVEICLMEGVGDPALKVFEDHMEPSFGAHCSGAFSEIDFQALEVFTR